MSFSEEPYAKIMGLGGAISALGGALSLFGYMNRNAAGEFVYYPKLLIVGGLLFGVGFLWWIWDSG